MPIGIPGLLGVAFVVLKLCGVISWSWWLVTLPFWWFFGLLLLILIGVGGAYSFLTFTLKVLNLFDSKKSKRNNGMDKLKGEMGKDRNL